MRRSLVFVAIFSVASSLKLHRVGIEKGLHKPTAAADGVRLGRRAWSTLAAASALSAVAPAHGADGECAGRSAYTTDGTWAQRSGEPFAASEFDGFQTTPSGLSYKVVETGCGNVKPMAGQTINVHYVGYLLDGKTFDSSRRSPLKFEVGAGKVIKGWDEGLLDMTVGEKRILKIPGALAYGSRGAGGVIPPDATLVFFVELMFIFS